MSCFSLALNSLEQRRDVGVSLEEGRGERSASRGHAQVLTRTGRAAVRATRQQKLHRLTDKTRNSREKHKHKLKE